MTAFPTHDPSSAAALVRRLQPLRAWLGLQSQTVGWSQRWRDSLGAALGLGVSGAVGWWWLGGAEGAVWLVAPMGALAVLLYALPSSPLARPWPVLAGNLVSAAVGVAVCQTLGSGPAAAAVAVGLTLLLMFALRCVHPPGGAVALLAVVGGAPVHALGWRLLLPVGLNAALMLGMALLLRRLLAPRALSPQVAVLAPASAASSHHTRDVAPQQRVGLTGADLDAALRGFGQLVDIDREQLEELLQQAQVQAWQRRFGRVRCADIMSRDVVTVEFATPLEEAWRLLHHHRIRALPVVDRRHRVIGIVTLADFLRHAQLDPTEPRSLGQRMRQLLRVTPGTHSDKPEVVGQIMTAPVQGVHPDEVVVLAVPRLSDLGLHHLPVVDADRRLLGMLTQSDLLAALYRVQTGI